MPLWEDRGVSFGRGLGLHSLPSVVPAWRQPSTRRPCPGAQAPASGFQWNCPGRWLPPVRSGGAPSSRPPPPHLWGRGRGGGRESLRRSCELGRCLALLSEVGQRTGHPVSARGRRSTPESRVPGPHLCSHAHMPFPEGGGPPGPHAAAWGRQVLTRNPLLPSPPFSGAEMTTGSDTPEKATSPYISGQGAVKGSLTGGSQDLVPESEMDRLCGARGKGPNPSVFPSGCGRWPVGSRPTQRRALGPGLSRTREGGPAGHWQGQLWRPVWGKGRGSPSRSLGTILCFTWE